MTTFPQHLPTSVQVVLRDGEGRVLLQKREDFRLWSLPGGGIELGETPEDAAIREACEETGFAIALERCVGFYWRPDLPSGGALIQVFEGSVTQKLSEPGWESVAIGWFPLDKLPRSVPGWTRTVLTDTTIHAAPVRRIQRLPLWKARLVRVLYALRRLRNRLMGRGS